MEAEKQGNIERKRSVFIQLKKLCDNNKKSGFFLPDELKNPLILALLDCVDHLESLASFQRAANIDSSFHSMSPLEKSQALVTRMPAHKVPEFCEAVTDLFQRLNYISKELLQDKKIEQSPKQIPVTSQWSNGVPASVKKKEVESIELRPMKKQTEENKRIEEAKKQEQRQKEQIAIEEEKKRKEAEDLK